MSLRARCPARCCHNVEIPLTEKEAEFLSSKGTVLRAIEPIRVYTGPKRGPLQSVIYMARGKPSRPEQRRFYYMEKCGLLTRGLSDENPFGQRCSAYIDPRRPTICGEFTAGSPVCRAMRKNAGI